LSIALYHLESCVDCEKIRLALAIERIDYQSLPIENDDRTEIMRISGQSEAPVLVDTDGSVLFEANRILRHLAASPRSKLLPEGRRDRSLTWVLVDRADARLSPICNGLKHGIDSTGSPLPTDERRVVSKQLREELAVFEEILGRGPFLFGDHPTVADVATHAQLNRLPDEAGFRVVEEFPRLSGWYERVMSSAGRRRAQRTEP
jgi:glutathione S-transferase